MSVPLLFDTHVLLWAFNDDQKLPRTVREVLGDTEQAIFVSAASIWEMSIKGSLGKLEIPKGFFASFPKLRFEKLDVTFIHAQAVLDLPLLHYDPFDRMLIAQAIVEKMTLVTVDKDILRYDVSTLKI